MPDARRQKLVIFIGAGASKCIGMPLMREFADAIRDAGVFDKNDQAHFDQIALECDRMLALIGGSARNIEQLASVIKALEWTKPDFKFSAGGDWETPAGCYRQLVRAINAVVDKPVPLAQLEPMKKLLQQAQVAETTIITTNYDLHIEFAAADSEIPIYLPFNREEGYVRNYDPAFTVRKTYSNDKSAAVKLCKLHGSINWYLKDDKAIKIDNDLLLLCDNVGKRTLARRRADELEHQGYSTLIVAPTMFKQEMGGFLAKQWTQAAEAIASADRIWFIGYSFPRGDTHVEYLLACAFGRTSRIRQIVIFDPEAYGIAERSKHLFSYPSHQQSLQLIEENFESRIFWPAVWDGHADDVVETRYSGNLHTDFAKSGVKFFDDVRRFMKRGASFGNRRS